MLGIIGAMDEEVAKIKEEMTQVRLPGQQEWISMLESCADRTQW